MGNPEVLTGAREPRAARGFADPSKPNPGLTAIPEGKLVIKFTHNKYRLQLTAPDHERLPDGRILKGARALVVQAVDRVAVLDLEKDERVIELLKEHSSFGTNGPGSGDFWDFADEIQQSKEKRIADALTTIKAFDDPESRKRIIEALQASGDDFQLPTKQAPQQTKKDEPSGQGEGAKK